MNAIRRGLATALRDVAALLDPPGPPPPGPTPVVIELRGDGLPIDGTRIPGMDPRVREVDVPFFDGEARLVESVFSMGRVGRILDASGQVRALRFVRREPVVYDLVPEESDGGVD